MIHILAITSTHAIPVHLSYGFMPTFVSLLQVKVTHTDVHTKKATLQGALLLHGIPMKTHSNRTLFRANIKLTC